MFLSVTCQYTHSSAGLNSMPGTYRPRPAMQLQCSSKKHHFYVVITNTISWVLSTVPKVSINSHGKQTAAQLCFLGTAEHCFSPSARLLWSVSTVLYLHGLHPCLSTHGYKHSPSMNWQAAHSSFALPKNYKQKNTGFVVCLRSSTQISRASTALPTMLNIWKSCWSKLNLLLCKMALQSSEPLEILS